MNTPFPGMDPYIERADLWPDFHDSLITSIRGLLQPLLRPRYVALTQERLYVVESDRPIHPDVSILRSPRRKTRANSQQSVLEIDTPVVFDLWREEIRQPLIQILDPTGNRVVTAIEVLSPDNKTAGEGRTSYLKKREEFWESGTSLVEIDLLRDGQRTVRVSKQQLDELGRWHYLVAVTRHSPARQEIYPIPLKSRLPRIAIPLADDDPDVSLDLQAALTRCVDEGPYPELLHYHEAPPGKVAAPEKKWCDQLLRKAGLK